MGSSRTRARTHVPCIGRRILNHCATREASRLAFKASLIASFFCLHHRLKFGGKSGIERGFGGLGLELVEFSAENGEIGTLQSSPSSRKQGIGGMGSGSPRKEKRRRVPGGQGTGGGAHATGLGMEDSEV